MFTSGCRPWVQNGACLNSLKSVFPHTNQGIWHKLTEGKYLRNSLIKRSLWEPSSFSLFEKLALRALVMGSGLICHVCSSFCAIDLINSCWAGFEKVFSNRLTKKEMKTMHPWLYSHCTQHHMGCVVTVRALLCYVMFLAGFHRWMSDRNLGKWVGELIYGSCHCYD